MKRCKNCGSELYTTKTFELVLDICEKCGYAECNGERVNMCKQCEHEEKLRNMKVVNVSFVGGNNMQKEMDELAKIINSGDCCGNIEPVKLTNYDIAINTFKEIAQDKDQTAQDRMCASDWLFKNGGF